MDDAAKGRAIELFGVLISRPPNPGELDSLIGTCETFEDFRIALIFDPRYTDRFGDVLERWRMMVPERPDHQVSLTALIRAIEALKDRLQTTEHMLGENEDRMIDAMKRLDDAVRSQIEQASQAKMLRNSITVAERRAIQLERAIRGTGGGVDA
jgi:hypothetical protein